MFLIRSAFWISLVILVLPSDERRQAELYGKAAAAANWTMTFCDRNGETCTKSAELWRSFKHKAEFGARLAGDLIQKGMSNGGVEPVAMPSGGSASEARVTPAVGRGPLAPGTLAPDDLQPKWRAQPKPPRV